MELVTECQRSMITTSDMTTTFGHDHDYPRARAVPYRDTRAPTRVKGIKR